MLLHCKSATLSKFKEPKFKPTQAMLPCYTNTLATPIVVIDACYAEPLC